MKKYSSELSVLYLVALLKEHKIRKVIASPGTTNLSFVASLQYDSFFEVYSCVDERSAAYMGEDQGFRHKGVYRNILCIYHHMVPSEL